MKRDSLRLYVTIKRGAPQSYLFLGPEVRVGRASDNNLTVASEYISRHHGVFVQDSVGWTYRDVVSRNGSEYMSSSGRASAFERLPAEPIRLKTGDRLRMGDVLVEIELPQEVVQSSWTADQAMTRLLSHETEAPQRSTVRALFEAAWLLGQCNDERQAFNVISKIVDKAVRQVSHLLLLEPESNQATQFQVLWHWSRAKMEGQTAGSESQTSEEESVQFSQTLVNRAVQEGRSLLWTSSQSVTASIHQAEIASSVLVPLRGSQGYQGVLQADCRGAFLRQISSESLQDYDLHVLTLLGEQLAATLDRFRTAKRIEAMFDGFVRASVKAIEARDKYTGGHSERVCRYSMLLAEAVNESELPGFSALRLSPDNLRTLRYSALLHDLGKVGVPEQVLNKPLKLSVQEIQKIFHRFQLAEYAVRSELAEQDLAVALQGGLTPEYRARREEQLREAHARLHTEKRWLRSLMGNHRVHDKDLERLQRLTQPFHGVVLLSPHQAQTLLACNRTLKPWEWKEMQLHAQKSRQLLDEIPWPCGLERIPQIVGSHHEKLDGSGYFEHLAGTALPTEVRILTICDIYGAVTGIGRRYLRKPMSRQQAFEVVLWPDATHGKLVPELVELLYAVTSKLPGGGILTATGEIVS